MFLEEIEKAKKNINNLASMNHESRCEIIGEIACALFNSKDYILIENEKDINQPSDRFQQSVHPVE